MARTLLTGNILRSGSIPTTALGGGVVTSSAQIIASLPTGALSSSAQVNYPDISNIPGGIASSSAQIKDYLPVDTVSSSVQVTAFLPTGTVSSSTQLPSGIASSSAQVTAYLPTGTVSSSGQISVFNTINGDQLATTGSNTFTAAQTISDTTNSTSYLDGALHVAGGMSVRKDVRVSGSLTVNGLLTAVSMSTQYVTASEYTIGTSKILLNDDDLVRFAGLSIVDSGSSSPTTASIFWDSLQHRFIYENLSGSAYNSSIIIAGPKHTGSLGDEPTLTTGYIPVATGGDHIDNSVMFQSGSNIGIGITNPSTALHVFGSSPQITISGTASSGNRGISFVDGNAAKYNFFVGAQNNVNNAFEITPSTAAGGTTYSTPSVVINSSGNVGIGTTVTDAALEISKAITFTSIDTFPQLLVKASGGSTGRRLNLAVDDASNIAFIQAVNRGTDTINLSLQRYGGNVGIGTASPGNLLHLKASTNPVMRLEGASDSAYVDYDGTRLQLSAGGGAMYFVTGNSEKARIDSSGNVGIGITNPTARLHVRDSTTSTGTVAIGHANYPGLIYSNAGTGEFRLDNRSSAAGGYITFYPNGQENTVGSEALRIDATLNIYTPGGSPISYGSGETYTIWSSEPEATAVSNDANWKSMKTFICSKSGTLKFKFSAYISSGTYYWAWRILKNGATVVASGYYSVGLDTGETASVHAYRRFVATVGPIAAGDSLVLQMISATGGGTPVTGNGQTLYAKEFRAYSSVPSIEHGIGSNFWGERVGIGTASPAQTLHVEGNAAIGTTGTEDILLLGRALSGGVSFQQAASFKLGRYQNAGGSYEAYTRLDIALRDNSSSSNYNTNTTVMTLTNAGNVGIGTTNPNNLLTLRGASAQVDIQSTADSQVPGIFMRYIDSSTAGTKIYYSTGDAVTYYDNLYSYTESTVYGSHDFRSKNASNVLTSRLYIRGNTGNIGIGTTNPGYKLDVAGSLNATSIRQITTTDVGAKYGRKVVGAQSSFDNPVVNLATVGNASNFVLIFRITVFQSVIAANEGNVQVGYAYARAGNNAVTTMTAQGTIGSPSVGALSWSGSTLRFTPVRSGNYDLYNIIVELSGEDNLSSF